MVYRVAMSGKPNLGCRIQLHPNFNLPLWERELRKYEDKNLVNFLRFGFPLGMQSRKGLDRKVIENHSLAQQFSEHVKKCIDKELKHNAMIGPFMHPSHPLYHCSPMLTRPKDISDRRVIVDLLCRDTDAVNRVTERDTYEGVQFTSQLPTLDHVLHQILSLREPR